MTTPAVADTEDLFATPDKDFDVPMARTAPAHFADLSQIAEEHPELQGDLEVEPDDEFVEPVPASVPQAVALPVAADDQPEVIELDGGTVTIEKVKNGYEAVLEQADGGGKEVFKGHTRNELLTNVLAAKLNATGQIRRLNKKLKVGTPIDAPAPVRQEPDITAKTLTANDIFEIKTALESDPDKAFDLRFQKKYGMSEEEFVALVQDTRKKAIRGQEAHQELSIESVSKEFLERNKDSYYPWEENGNNVMGWLVKNKLHRQVTKQDTFGSLSSELLEKGQYTVENLEEAVEDLRDSGLLIPLPEEPTQQEPPAPAPAPVPVVAAPRQVQPAAPQSPRIVRQTRQPRGGLGLRPSSGTVPTPETDKAPSVDDLENASTDQINELFAAVRKHARQQPNRRS